MAGFFFYGYSVINDIKEFVVGGDLVVAEGAILGICVSQIAAGGDAGVSAAEHVGGQTVAEDDHTTFVGDAEIGEDVIEVLLRGFADADLLGDIDAVNVGLDARALKASDLGDRQAVGCHVDLHIVIGMQLSDELGGAGQHEAALGQIMLIHFIDRAEVDRISAELLEGHAEAACFQFIARDLGTLERFPAPEVARAVGSDHLIGGIDAEMSERLADGGSFGKLEIVDGLVRVKQDDIVGLTQRGCPPLYKCRCG